MYTVRWKRRLLRWLLLLLLSGIVISIVGCRRRAIIVIITVIIRIYRVMTRIPTTVISNKTWLLMACLSIWIVSRRYYYYLSSIRATPTSLWRSFVIVVMIHIDLLVSTNGLEVIGLQYTTPITI